MLLPKELWLVLFLCQKQKRREEERSTRSKIFPLLLSVRSAGQNNTAGATEIISIQKSFISTLVALRKLYSGWLWRSRETLLILKTRKGTFYGDFYVSFVPDRTKDRLVRFWIFYVTCYVGFVPGPIGTILVFYVVFVPERTGPICTIFYFLRRLCTGEQAGLVPHSWLFLRKMSTK